MLDFKQRKAVLQKVIFNISKQDEAMSNNECALWANLLVSYMGAPIESKIETIKDLSSIIETLNEGHQKLNKELKKQLFMPDGDIEN